LGSSSRWLLKAEQLSTPSVTSAPTEAGEGLTGGCTHRGLGRAHLKRQAEQSGQSPALPHPSPPAQPARWRVLGTRQLLSIPTPTPRPENCNGSSLPEPWDEQKQRPQTRPSPCSAPATLTSSRRGT